MKPIITFYLSSLLLFASCKKTVTQYDASGTFEAVEIIVSAETSGKLLAFSVGEGDELQKGQSVGQIDVSNLELQKDQIEASIEAVGQKQGDAGPQIDILEQQLKSADAQLNTLHSQLNILKKEQARVRKMFSAEAATPKQMDDINGQVDVLENRIASAETQKSVLNAQIKSARRTVAIKNRGISSEKAPLRKKEEQIADLINRGTITNTRPGTVLLTYANEGEMVGAGRPLYKLADMSEMTLRAYISGSQLGQIKQGQKVDIYIDKDEDNYKKYEGVVAWISPKAEFTPKTIQTKDERANLVYAVKISVKNDGYLKIGMYGEVDFENEVAEADE